MILLEEGVFKSVKTNGFEILYKGLPFKLGINQSKFYSWFLDNFPHKSIVDIAREISGIYFIILKNINSNELFAFTDNSSIYKVYYSSSFFSDSILSLAKAENMTSSSVNKEKLLEYLRYGGFFPPETILNGILQLNGNSVLHVQSDGEYKIIRKKESVAETSFENLFEGLQISFNGMHVNSDITGGMDSRLIAAASKYHNLDFSLFTASGGNLKETEIASTAAQVLQVTHYKMENIFADSDDEIILSDNISEGLANTINMHRNMQVALWRKSMGFGLTFNGNGGAFYKEIYLMHEFPFYSVGKFDPAKTYSMRIEPVSFQFNLLSDDLIALKKNVDESIIEKIRSVSSESKAESIMNTWYKLELPTVAGKITTAVLNNYHDVYSPFIEYSLFMYSLRQSVCEKFFDSWHRRLITKYNRDLARLRTTNDVSASSEFQYIFKDSFITLYNRSYRLIRKFAQKTAGKTLFLENALNNLYLSKFRKSFYVKSNIDYLVQNNFVKPRIDIYSARDSLLGNLVSISSFLQKIPK